MMFSFQRKTNKSLAETLLSPPDDDDDVFFPKKNQ